MIDELKQITTGNKEGMCPNVQPAPRSDSSVCDDECRTDGDCKGQHKCCFNGCAKSCLLPVLNDTTTAAPTPAPERYQPAGAPPRIVDDETHVASDEGSVATLKCEAEGSPAPTIYWKFGNQEVPL